MKTIPLSQGKVTIVDDNDFCILSYHKWRAEKHCSTFYAVYRVRISKNNWRTRLMHRIILGLQPGDKQITDHRDGNGLNNQRANLRRCTQTQNNQSSRKRTGCTSKYKGVHWNSHSYNWTSRIQVNRKQTHLGQFESESDAARAYDAAAVKHYGEFALTNKALGLY